MPIIESYHEIEDRIAAFIAARSRHGDEFNSLATEMYTFQRRENAAYSQYCRSLGALERIEHWREIPAVPQSAFKHAALRAFPAEQTAKTFRTSGTTGEGFGEHHFRSLRLYDAAILEGWDSLELPRLPQWVLTPRADFATHSSLSHMMNVLAQRALDDACHFVDAAGKLDDASLRAAFSRCHEPVMLLGTALAFLHLFEWMRRDHLQFILPRGSCAMETGGYKGSGRSLTRVELYAMFAECLGLPDSAIINEYGMTELSSQFYSRGLGQTHRGPSWTRTMIINPETGKESAIGEIGILRIFDLANLGSVLAIETQDLAMQREDGFELLGRDPAALPRGCSRAADEALRSGDE